ncbi:MAG: hypothetical protein R3F62_18025 [Planctomycetota bacterium]
MGGRFAAVVLCATLGWAQEPAAPPRVFDLERPTSRLPPYLPLGVPGPRSAEEGWDPERQPDATADLLDALAAELPADPSTRRAGARIVTSSPRVAQVLERALEPYLRQLRDAPRVGVRLVPLRGDEAAALPLGPLPEQAARVLAAREAWAQASARPRGGWLHLRATQGVEVVVDYEANATGALPVREAVVSRIETGVALRLRVERLADGAVYVRGLVEWARPLACERVRFDGQPLDLPSADRLRVVGAWTLSPGRPTLLAASSCATAAELGAWALVAEVEGGSPTRPAGATQRTAWRHALSPRLPADYTAAFTGDPLRTPKPAAERRRERARSLRELDGLPPYLELEEPSGQALALGTPAEHERVEAWVAAGAAAPCALRVQVAVGDGAAPRPLRVWATPGRPLSVLVARERTLLVGWERINGGCGAATDTVIVPRLALERAGVALSLDLDRSGQLRAQGALQELVSVRPLEVEVGTVSEVERRRLDLAAEGDPRSGGLRLGQGPWGAGEAWALVEVER